MKSKIVVFSLLAVVPMMACRHTKEAAKPAVETTEEKPGHVDHGSQSSEDSRVMGVVRIEEGCSAVIEVTYGDVIYRYAPLNLEEKYRKEGLRLKFAFQEEKNFQGVVPCESINQVISVSDVTPYR